jgi:hypothetical protein
MKFALNEWLRLTRWKSRQQHLTCVQRFISCSDLPDSRPISHGYLEEIPHANLFNVIHDVLIVLQIASLVMLIITRLSVRLWSVS